jgi:hypothetical protein
MTCFCPISKDFRDEGVFQQHRAGSNVYTDFARYFPKLEASTILSPSRKTFDAEGESLAISPDSERGDQKFFLFGSPVPGRHHQENAKAIIRTALQGVFSVVESFGSQN